MTPDIAICLTIVVVAVVLFAWDRIPSDIVALGVLLSIIATGLVSADKAFAGFGSGTVIMILGFLIMTAGLSHTGIVDVVGRAVLNRTGGSPNVLVAVIMVSVSVLSAFVSNTAATAFFIPVVLGFAAANKTSPSRYLLPLAFASILTSSVSLISTSTNIVISELLRQYKQPEMGMFELAPVGIPIAIAGLIYMWTIGIRLMPNRGTDGPVEDVGDRKYQADLVIPPDSPLIGRPIAESPVAGMSGFKLVKVLRQKKVFDFTADDIVLEEGDELVVEGRRRELLKIKDIKGIEIKADVHLANPDVPPEDIVVVEGVLMPGSPLIGLSLRKAEFHNRYNLQVLGINRAGYSIRQKASRVRMRLGDVLLLQGTTDNVKALERGNLFSIFGGVEPVRLKTSHGAAAVAIFAAAILAATFNLVALPVAAIGGAFLMMLSRCISPEEAYRRVEWKVLILIGSMLSLGAAMEATGTGKFLAMHLIALIGDQSPVLVLMCFFILTVALTQPMSNQAAAIVIMPIAFETAFQLGLNPRSFAMMIAVAASCSYLTPLEPSSLMVFGPGKYRFMDFVKVGAPLTLVIFAIAMVLVPWFWPLRLG